jgi:hypothetical protein
MSSLIFKNLDDPTEPINALIDITDSQLDDQLLELEKLTTIDQATITTTNNKTIPSASNSGDNLVELSVEHDKLFSDLLSPLSPETNHNLNPDLLGINEANSFDADWTAAFGNTSNQQQPFPTSTPSSNTFLPSSLLNELLASTNKINQPILPSSTNSKPKPMPSGKTTDKSNWFNLFAELDPIQNPDAIGKSSMAEFDRNC